MKAKNARARATRRRRSKLRKESYEKRMELRMAREMESILVPVARRLDVEGLKRVLNTRLTRKIPAPSSSADLLEELYL